MAIDRGLGDAGARRHPLDRYAAVPMVGELVDRRLKDHQAGMGDPRIDAAVGPDRHLPTTATVRR